MQPLLRALDAPDEEEMDLTRLAGFMDKANRLLHVIRKQLGRLLTPEIRGRLEAVAAAVTLFETGESVLVCGIRCIGQRDIVSRQSPIFLCGCITFFGHSHSLLF